MGYLQEERELLLDQGLGLGLAQSVLASFDPGVLIKHPHEEHHGSFQVAGTVHGCCCFLELQVGQTLPFIPPGPGTPTWPGRSFWFWT